MNGRSGNCVGSPSPTNAQIKPPASRVGNCRTCTFAAEPFALRRLRRHVDDRAADVDLPTVEDAADRAVLVARERERRAPVRTAFVEETEPAVGGTEDDVALAEQPDALRRPPGRSFALL